METTTESELFELLEFVPEVPCESTFAKGEAADWYMVCRGCGSLATICDRHLARLRRDLRRHPEIGVTTCGMRSANLELLFALTPVKPHA